MSWELWALLLLSAGGWYWLNGLNVREAAIAAGRQACVAQRMQLLDDTVCLIKTRLARDTSGQLRFERTYRFEYSSTGDNRYIGHINMLGQHIKGLTMDDHYLVSEAKVVRIDDWLD